MVAGLEGNYTGKERASFSFARRPWEHPSGLGRGSTPRIKELQYSILSHQRLTDGASKDLTH